MLYVKEILAFYCLKQGLINVQNEGNECFRWCLVRYLNPADKNTAKIWNVDKKISKQIDFKDAKFSVYKKGLCRNRETK